MKGYSSFPNEHNPLSITSEDITEVLNKFNNNVDSSRLTMEKYNQWAGSNNILPRYAPTLVGYSNFDSWVKLLESRDMRAGEASKTVNEEDIIESLQEVSALAQTDVISKKLYGVYRDKCDGYMPSPGLIIDTFGSFTEAVRVAGLNNSRRRKTTHVTEEEVKSMLEDHLNCIYPQYDMQKEVSLYRHGVMRGRADICIDGVNLAVECKNTSATQLKHGIGQAAHYNLCDYNAYVCSHKDAIRNINIDAALASNIGLIGVSSDSIEVFVDNGVEI